jgi:hypothetical protein
MTDLQVVARLSEPTAAGKGGGGQPVRVSAVRLIAPQKNDLTGGPGVGGAR